MEMSNPISFLILVESILILFADALSRKATLSHPPAVGITGDKVEKIAARLEKNIKNQNASRNKNYNLSLSLGVSLYDPEKPCSVDELIAHADEMMFEHKRLKQKA